jgi:hypothetical protein
MNGFVSGGNPASSPPRVSSLGSSSGPAAGGNTVTVNGQGLTGATAVRFGGTLGTNLVVSSDSALTVRAPAGKGTVAVTVTTAAGTSAPVNYTYLQPPTLSRLSATSGSSAGGYRIVVQGAGLGDRPAVTFGGTTATVVSYTPTTIQLVVPAHVPGSVDVTVTTSAGAATLRGGFSYTASTHR